MTRRTISSSIMNKKAGAAASTKRAAPGSGDEQYVTATRRVRTSKEKVSSVSDYIRTVMEQLKSQTPLSAAHPPELTGYANTAAGTSFRVPAPAVGGAQSTSDGFSEQQVWLMIVEKMREEIIKARDVHRANLYDSKTNVRSQIPSNFQKTQEEITSEPSTQYNCTACSPLQRPATAITVCGHYLCWSCLCKWHHRDASSSVSASKKECPCCKKILSKSQVTFVGEKHEENSATDDHSLRGGSLSSLATDQRDKLLQAAAIPILASKLQANIFHLSAEKRPFLNTQARSHCAGSLEHVKTYHAENSTEAEDDNFCTSSSQYHALSIGHDRISQMNVETFVGGRLCVPLNKLEKSQEPSPILDNYAGHDFVAAGVLSLTNKSTTASVGPQDSSFSQGNTDVSTAYIEACNDMPAAKESPYSWSRFLSSPTIGFPDGIKTLNSVGEEQHMNECTVPWPDYIHGVNASEYMSQMYANENLAYDYTAGEFISNTASQSGIFSPMTIPNSIQKVLEIEASEGDFNETEMKELKQLQETLKEQLTSQNSLNAISYEWLTTLLASTSHYSGEVSGTDHHDVTHGEGYPSCVTSLSNEASEKNQLMSLGYYRRNYNCSSNIVPSVFDQYVGPSTIKSYYTSPEQPQALIFPSDSAFSSTSVASPSSENNPMTEIMASSCATIRPYQDDANSNWRCIYSTDVWDWSLSDNPFTI
ncbi:hypothetical protein KP509_17G050800 [Ceratopteris richardii]|uniref:RING-type E3 ubiquitin transferase n=1 Tax=Ceratopteris richardii TaxID=49495 RepID=A0A8T2SZC1_CERRI|nr:hypothetical protein KP509_17G050800 [Ceratopteris richardii]